MLLVRLAKLGTIIAFIALVVIVCDEYRHIRDEEWLAIIGIGAAIIINYIALNSAARGKSYLSTLMQRKRMEELRKIKALETELGDWEPEFYKKHPGLIRRCINAVMSPDEHGPGRELGA